MTTIDNEKLEPVAQKTSDSSGTVTSGAKPGWKTSEFWSMAVVVGPYFVDAIERIAENQPQNPWLAVAAAIVVGLYALARAHAKRPA